MTNPTPREIQLVEAALKAAAEALRDRAISDEIFVSNGEEAIRSLDPAAIVASVPRKLDPELKAALEQAAKAGDLHAVLPNGGVAFINRGDQQEDTADLDCPHCGGSGHKEDVRDALSAQEQVEPTPILAAPHSGMRVDYRGLFTQARKELRASPGLAEMFRQFEDHVTELGRRWYAGDAAVVDELLQLYCVEKDARALLSANQGK